MGTCFASWKGKGVESMPKRLKVRFSLDAREAELLRAVMSRDGWPSAWPSGSAKYILLRFLADDALNDGVSLSGEAEKRAKELAGH